MNQKNLSKWLKFITVLVTIMLSVGIFMIIPAIGRDIVCVNPECSSWYIPWLLFVWILGIPCYIVLIIFWGICDEIKKDNSFSMKNAKALSWISKLALLDSVLCFVGVIIFGIMGWMHFSMILIISFTILCGIAIAVVSAALGHLVQKASKIKDENDLTI